MKLYSNAASRWTSCLLICLAFPPLVFGERLTLDNYASRNTSTTLTQEGGLRVDCPANSKGYLGVSVLPDSGEFFDFSKHGRVEAVVRNLGDVDLPITMRVDNQGNSKDEPFSAELIRLSPGETSAIVVFFGRRFGWKKGFPIDPAKVSQVLFYTVGATKPRQFIVESVVAVEEPGQTPDEWLAGGSKAPIDGVVFGRANPLVSKNN